MGEIRLRTHWLRSEFDGCDCCSGPHVFGVNAEVGKSDYISPYARLNDLQGHISRAIRSFPDGSELRITVEQVGP